MIMFNLPLMPRAEPCTTLTIKHTMTNTGSDMVNRKGVVERMRTPERERGWLEGNGPPTG